MVMNNLIKSILLSAFVLSSTLVLAQRDTTNTGAIDTERLIIVKPYSPTVSDAVKPKQHPQKETGEVLERQPVSYNIFSVPVASTFKPEKGKASSLQQIKAPDLYDTYIALGLGNYFNAFAEVYSTIALNDWQNMTIGLDHHSSQGGIGDLRYGKKDKFYDTKLSVGFNGEEEYFFWGVNIGLLHQHYNWYGAFDDWKNLDYSSLPYGDMEALKPKHNYTGVFLDGDLNFKDMVFDKVGLHYHHFGDDFHGSENHIKINPKLVFPVMDENISVDIFGDYLSGSFGRAIKNEKGYSWLTAGISPSYNYDYDIFSFNLGVNVVYSNDSKFKRDDVYIYPKVKASLDVAGDYFKLYGGVEGDLEQNNYHQLAQQNPYLSPDLLIAPTNTQYNAFFGVKGKLVEGFHYDIRGNYQSQKDKALFTANPGAITRFDASTDGPKWNRFDSFSVIYDNIKTFSLHGGLEYTYNNDFSMSLKADYHDYDSEYMEKAWNLPKLEAAFTTDYRISDHWGIGADFFYVGKRYDFLNTLTERVSVDDYFDANFRLTYKLNDYIGFFAKGHNILNQKYQRWYGYDVQQAQILVGLEVQF